MILSLFRCILRMCSIGTEEFMSERSIKENTSEPKIGDVCAAQPCSGVREVVSHVLGTGMGCDTPGADAVINAKK